MQIKTTVRYYYAIEWQKKKKERERQRDNTKGWKRCRVPGYSVVGNAK